MAATQPPSITPAPTPAPQRGQKATFSARVDAFVTWLTAAVVQFAALATNVYNNAVDAFNSASTASTAATAAVDAAASAAAATNTTLWMSGATVQQNANVISPADHRTYRRKTAAGAGTVDPSLDTVNYVLLSADATALVHIGKADVSAPVANIDFLNLFSDLYSKYVIEIEGLVAESDLCLRVASGGVIASGASDYGAMKDPTNNPTSMEDTAQLRITNGGFGFLTIELRGARTSSPLKSVSARGRGGVYPHWREGGVNLPSVLSGFRLYTANGTTFTAGAVRVYGVRA